MRTISSLDAHKYWSAIIRSRVGQQPVLVLPHLAPLFLPLVHSHVFGLALNHFPGQLLLLTVIPLTVVAPIHHKLRPVWALRDVLLDLIVVVVVQRVVGTLTEVLSVGSCLFAASNVSLQSFLA